MIHDPAIAWAALLMLGALHGINPAMGWLFAVSLGLQERSRRAVWRALGPLALGHAGAIVVAVAAALALGLIVPMPVLKGVVALLLVGVGVTHLIRHRHPGRGGMRMGVRDLVMWSFLMASAHGAGLMALPFFPAHPGVPGADGVSHAGHGAVLVGPGAGWATGLLGSGLHTAGYLFVTGLIAWIVYEWVGLRLLRTAWINLNLIWAGALILTGGLTLIL
jgi:hypothetical protein